MTAPTGGKLYTPHMLSLAVECANYPLDDQFALRVEERSRTCGSTLALGVDLDRHEAVARIGLQVSACAVGQSAAAIMAKEAKGRTGADAEAALSEIEAWLSSDAPLPNWPGFSALGAVRDHAGRHSALLLPWKALKQALCERASAG